MKEPEGKRKQKKPDGPAVSYTPEQRRLIRNGLGIWARVAIRSYLRQRGGEGPTQAGTKPLKEDED